MILSDSEIRRRLSNLPGEGKLVIAPFPHDDCIQAASVDLHLDSKILRYQTNETVDLRRPNTLWDMDIDTQVLAPGEFVLGSTVERVEIPNDLVARVEGKSSLGRIGLMVHITAGFIDPGFKGNITLELKNLNTAPIMLWEGMAISQLCFEELVGVVVRPYGTPGLGSKYQDSNGVVGPRIPSDSD